VTSPRIETEVDQLRRQLASAKADNEILRKSAMYFAKESH
jgi:transposase-like protein